MYRYELKGTTESADVAKYLLLEPPLPFTSKIPYSLISAAAIALLPVWARVELKLPYLPVAEKIVVKPIGQFVASTIRWATAVNQPETNAAAVTDTVETASN
jgi:hypothetical protein